MIFSKINSSVDFGTIRMLSCVENPGSKGLNKKCQYYGGSATAAGGVV